MSEPTRISGQYQHLHNAMFDGDLRVSGYVALYCVTVRGSLIAEDEHPFFSHRAVTGEIIHPAPANGVHDCVARQDPDVPSEELIALHRKRYAELFGFTREGLSALLRIIDVATDAPDELWNRFAMPQEKEEIFKIACANLDRVAALLPPVA